ncbi:ribosome maturation factor RimP [Lactobacillus sp. PV037]|uniref:ribosome maturation factor RimP n=1 Tax=unclassified Lactobacillus TaxID=2620435 RepID=UPI00223F64C5|nr:MULTISPECIES: ribosome maturation factor RimP [unclassified Lactobacillus]QNQ82128.1 ribosome maturation factor RimP [Lactobacillus sp. PV012]QNQ83837.1 ribosome maturation factor RimP [Lactobacillus sp. PV037]
MAKVTEIVANVVAPIAQARGDELVDVEYVKERSQYYLRVYVDRVPGGIDIEEIAELSDIVSEKLDELEPDPFPQPYILELSSPGLERPIKTEKDWEKAKGEYVHVGLYKKIDGNKMYEGTLKDFDEDKVILDVKIKTRRKEIEIPRDAIANIRFAVEF